MIKAAFFLLILVCQCSIWFSNIQSKTEFVRVVFNSNASYEATIIWNQYSGEFRGLYLNTAPPKENINIEDIFNVKNFDISTNRYKGMNNHIIRLKKLKPNEKYFFVLIDSDGNSRTYHFSTVSNQASDSLAFIAGGDSRDIRKTRIKANQMVSKLKAHAVLFNGDFTGIDTEKQWKEWFMDWESSISSDGRITPMVVTRGNHELGNKVMVKLFDVPHSKVFYATTFGGDLLNIVSLNSEIWKFGAQKLFLRKTLKEHQDFYWQIPQYHRPIRAHVKAKKEMNTQYKNFVPEFEKYENVRLCLENDSHTCKVTWPIVSDQTENADEGFIRNDSIGIVYAGEGCWGAPLRTADDKKSWTRDAEAVNQFNLIFVSKEKIELRTVLYENVDEIIENSENTRFQLPSNLMLWGPNHGTLVEIYPRR